MAPRWSRRLGLRPSLFRAALATILVAFAYTTVGASCRWAFAPPPAPGPRLSPAAGQLPAHLGGFGASARPASTAPPRSSSVAAAAGAAAAAAAAAAALIVQNRGGGHGEIGYHLALGLRKKGLSVTLLGDAAAARSQPPFSAYDKLEAEGVNVAWADLAQEGAFADAAEEARAAAGRSFDYVFDNENVCPGEVQDACQRWRPQLYAYVSSAGVYEAVGDAPLLEDGPTKATSSQLAVEQRAAGLGDLPWCAFRPQYIYGPLASKRDYLDYFFDRLTRGLPVPLPGDGQQRTTLTHVEDVASMLARTVEVPAVEVVGEAFNCASDRRVSYLKILADVGACLGMDREAAKARAVFYPPGSVEIPKGAPRFPFRDSHFGVGVAKAKEKLHWRPSRRLDQQRLAEYLAEYRRLGRDQRPLDLRFDEAVFSSLGQRLESAMNVEQPLVS